MCVEGSRNYNSDFEHIVTFDKHLNCVQSNFKIKKTFIFPEMNIQFKLFYEGPVFPNI